MTKSPLLTTMAMIQLNTGPEEQNTGAAHTAAPTEDQLHQVYKRYNLVTQATHDVVWDWDLASNNIWRNDNYKQIFGYTDEGPYTTRDIWFSKIHPDDRDLVLQSIQEVMQKGETNWTAEYRYQKEDGTYALAYERGFVMYDAAGKPYRMLGSMQDITERKKNEKLLEQKDKNIRNLIQHAHVAIAVYKGEDMIVEIVNENMLKLMERSDDIIGKPMLPEFPFLEGQRIAEIQYEVLHSGKPFYGKEMNITLLTNGVPEERFFDFACTPILEDDTVTGVMIVTTEVTDGVRGRKKLEESHKELQFVMDIMPTMVWHTQPSGAADFFNKAYLDYTGLPMEQLTGMQYAQLIHPEDLAELVKVYNQAFANGTSFKIEHRLLGKDGEYRWFLTRSIPLKDENGRITKWYGTTTDIQEQKTTSDLLEQRVKDRTWELELRNKELEQFTHVSHHDLQEPLRKILTFSDRLKQDSDNRLTDTSKYWLNRITEAARRMKAVLNDVLNFASLSKEEQFESVDLNEVLAAVKFDVELLIAEKGAMIYAEELPTITAISPQMHQLFYNLVNNALKYAKADEPPVINISCKTLPASAIKRLPHLDPTRHYYEITVQDNGIGFDQENAQKIFEMFQRLHSKHEYEGTGIGLALCKKIVLGHDGQITAEGKPGQGATFKIFLPA